MASKSLAATLPELKSFKLPSILDAPQEQMKSVFNSTYVTFAHPKRTDEWAKLRAVRPSVEESDMFLVEKIPIYLPSAKVAMLACRQLWVESNQSGTQILAVSVKPTPKPFKEIVESIVLVYLEDRVVPATMVFKTTKCGAALSLSDALAECATPEWANKSQAHAESLRCVKPFMRYYGIVELLPSRIGRESGLPYTPTAATIHPTSVPEWKLLAQALQDPKFESDLEIVSNRFESRVKELLAKAK